jgi:hypothetical protein
LVVNGCGPGPVDFCRARNRFVLSAVHRVVKPAVSSGRTPSRWSTWSMPEFVSSSRLVVQGRFAHRARKSGCQPGEGARNEIASQLGIAENTVKRNRCCESMTNWASQIGLSSFCTHSTHRDTQAHPEIVATRTHLGERETIQCVDPNQVSLANSRSSINRTN